MNTTNELEIEKFSKISHEWWNEDGKFKPLHKINRARFTYLKDLIKKEYRLSSESKFSELNIIDIGCGGGLICEPFAKIGVNITGIDASKKNIEIALEHSKKNNLNIDYHNKSLDEFSKASDIQDINKNNKFDIVLALEIIEHVDNYNEFINKSFELVKKDGLLFISTINRNIKSLIFAKYTAEYILRWLPRGTHDWKKFLKPSEIIFLLENKAQIIDISGFKFNILKNEWVISKDIDMNYIICLKKIFD